MNTEKIVRGIWGAALSEDRQGIKNRIQMYKGKWADQLREEITKQFSAEARRRLIPLVSTKINILKKIVDEQAQVYKKAPRRTVKDSKGTISERWAEIEKEAKMNIFWKEDNKYTRLCNHTLIKIVSRDGEIELDMFTPDAFMIFTDPTDWKKINAIAVEIGARTPPPGGNAIERPYNGMQTQIWAAKDTETPWGIARAGMVSKTKEGKIVSSEPNPYREPAEPATAGAPAEEAEIMLPFVLTYKSFPIDALVECGEGDDIYHANMEIGVLNTLLNEIMKFQSFNQPYAITPVGTTIPEGQQMGPWAFLSIKTKDGAGAQVGTLQLETDPGKYHKVIRDQMADIMAQNGVPPSAYNLQASPASGYSRKIERMALEEIRENDVEYYRDFEEEVFEKIRVVNNYHNPDSPIPFDAVFSIDFAESTSVYTVDETIKEETHELANNLTTEAKLLMNRNPDLSEIAAAQEIMENRIANINIAPLPEFGAPSPQADILAQGNAAEEPAAQAGA